MYCYRCNGTLDLRRDTCTKCGTDIRVFKKIVYASNRYYNSALVKAEARNLTGAREDLKQSLYLYKNNTNARNLLGLVYYAMGEPAEALKEWVISKNYAPESQVADRYINKMRHSVREIDSEGHGVKKLNQAINYVQNDAEDLALIQLKKICSVHTNMTKAYNLLALMYMKDGKYEQAKKALNKCLAVDKGNVQAFRYMKEIEEAELRNGTKNVGVVGEEDREQLIIPVRFRDYGSYLANALYILIGLVLGMLIAWFVIVPGRVQKEMGSAEETQRSYEEVISSLQERVAISEADETSTEEVYSIDPTSDESGTEEPKVIEQLPEKPVVNTSWGANQHAVEECVTTVNIPDYPATIKTFLTIDPKSLSEANKDHYRNISGMLFDAGNVSTMFATADALLAEEKYEEAADYYNSMSFLFPENGDIKLKAAEAYEKAGQQETAANRYWLCAVLYPDTPISEVGTAKYKELTGNEEVKMPETPIDIAAETEAKPLQYYLDQLE